MEKEIKEDWYKVENLILDQFGEKPGIDVILYLIGMQEKGEVIEKQSKELKQDLIHIGTCKVLSLSGYYKLEGLDNEGWPIWIKDKTIPKMELKEQEVFLKYHIIDYFKNELNLI